MGNFIKIQKILGALVLSWSLMSCLTAVAAPVAGTEPLAILCLDTDGNGSAETIELYGSKMLRGSSYHEDLLLLVKNSSGELLTAYVPSIKGGYSCFLEKTKITGQGEQLLLAVSQGGDNDATEYRILDFSDLKAVKELFNGSDNMGIAAYGEYLPNFRSKITFADGSTEEENLTMAKTFYEERGLYASDGSLLKGYRRPSVSKIISLVPVDIDKDGTMELLSLQNIQGLGNDDLLAKLAGVWSYDNAGGWQLENKTLYNAGKNEDDKFHRSYNDAKWNITPRQAVFAGNSLTYPVFVAAGANEAQNKVNRDFAIIAAPYLAKLSVGDCELDYTVTFVSTKYISMVFFGVMNEFDKEIFTKLPLNIDTTTGKRLEIGNVLNLQDRDLLPVLQLLARQDKLDFSEGVPENWYYNGSNFVFCQRGNEGQWLEAVVAAEDLKKFMLRPELF